VIPPDIVKPVNVTEEEEVPEVLVKPESQFSGIFNFLNDWTDEEL